MDKFVLTTTVEAIIALAAPLLVQASECRRPGRRRAGHAALLPLRHRDRLGQPSLARRGAKRVAEGARLGYIS